MLGGYSTIWLARALPPDGELITLELSEKHAKVAQENIENAGLSTQVKIVVGPAHESMLQMQPETPFDFIFIDADKSGNRNYFTEAKRLVRKDRRQRRTLWSSRGPRIHRRERRGCPSASARSQGRSGSGRDHDGHCRRQGIRRFYVCHPQVNFRTSFSPQRN